MSTTLPAVRETLVESLPDSDLSLNPLTVQTYIQAATSENTRKAYQQDIRHFMRWGGLLPATPEMIIRYLQQHAAVLNPRTLSRRLVALKNWHIYQGFPDPTSHAFIKKTLAGIQHIHGKPRERAPAMTIEYLIEVIRHLCSQSSLKACRDLTLLLVGFFGAFRRSELVNIQREHVNFIPEGMEILIPRSKTDQPGEGQTCAIPNGNETLCPVSALMRWCDRANIQSGPVFRGVNRRDAVGTNPLTMQTVSLIVKSLAKQCGLPNAEQFSSHSLRRGFATTASRKGAPFITIMRHGRWKHEGTVLGYIEEGQRFEENAAGIILQDNKSS